MKIGDKLRCIKTVYNLVNSPLFISGEVYEVLYILNDGEEDYITLNHILYANEYGEFSLSFISKNFITLKEERKLKIDQINKK